MTRAEIENKMAELKAIAEAGVKEHNALIAESRFDEKVDSAVTEAINEYTGLARQIAFDECKAAENPMHEACTRLVFETIKTKDEPIDKESKIKVRKIEPAYKVIDLKRLKKHCDGNLGENPEWIYALEKFNFALTAQKAQDLGIDPTEINDSYAMTKIAKEFKLGRNPASKTNLLKTLTQIVQMMIGEEFKPLSHDVNYLLSIWSKKDRNALKVVCANHSHMRQYVQEICHRILTGKSYEVVYKKAKK